MLKLVFLALALIPLVIGGLIIWALLRWLGGPTPKPVKEDTVPETVRTVAFIVLVILLFGVTSGFLGAA